MAMIIGYGLCSIVVRDIDDDGKWIKFPPSKHGDFSFETTAGDELAADIEGGGFNGGKSGLPVYELSFIIDADAERKKKPLTDINRFIPGHVAVFMQFNNSAYPGIYMPYSMGCVKKACVGIGGGEWTYSFKANEAFPATCSVELAKAAKGAEFEVSSLPIAIIRARK